MLKLNETSKTNKTFLRFVDQRSQRVYLPEITLENISMGIQSKVQSGLLFHWLADQRIPDLDL